MSKFERNEKVTIIDEDFSTYKGFFNDYLDSGLCSVDIVIEGFNCKVKVSPSKIKKGWIEPKPYETIKEYLKDIKLNYLYSGVPVPVEAFEKELKKIESIEEYIDYISNKPKIGEIR